MKTLLVLTLLCTLATSPAQEPVTPAEPVEPVEPKVSEVKLGDFLWHGTYYRVATAHVSKGIIFIESPRDGVVRIPVATAPVYLLKKLSLPVTPVIPGKPVEAGAKFGILGATEAQLVAHYGAAQPGEEPASPATKVVFFQADGFKLATHLYEGKCGRLLAVKEEGQATPEQITQLLERAGGPWKQDGEIYTRADGARAMMIAGSLWAESGPFQAARKKAAEEATPPKPQ